MGQLAGPPFVNPTSSVVVPTFESLTGGTVPVADPYLVFPGLLGGHHYALDMSVAYEVTGAGLLNWQIHTVGRIGHSDFQAIMGIDQSANATLAIFEQSSPTQTAPNPAGGLGLGMINFRGSFIFNGTASTNSVIFAWAPSVAADTASILEGSWAQLTQLD